MKLLRVAAPGGDVLNVFELDLAYIGLITKW